MIFCFSVGKIRFDFISLPSLSSAVQEFKAISRNDFQFSSLIIILTKRRERMCREGRGFHFAIAKSDRCLNFGLELLTKYAASLFSRFTSRNSFHLSRTVRSNIELTKNRSPQFLRIPAQCLLNFALKGHFTRKSSFSS